VLSSRRPVTSPPSARHPRQVELAPSADAAFSATDDLEFGATDDGVAACPGPHAFRTAWGYCMCEEGFSYGEPDMGMRAALPYRRDLRVHWGVPLPESLHG
jgi:hypothetical protein